MGSDIPPDLFRFPRGVPERETEELVFTDDSVKDVVALPMPMDTRGGPVESAEVSSSDLVSYKFFSADLISMSETKLMIVGVSIAPFSKPPLP